MAKLFLMRHAETYFNKWHKIQGWCDSALTPKGVEQAQEIRNYFQKNKIKFDKRYSSTSERACDTLEIICKNAPYIRMKSLKECNFGKFEGADERLNPPYPFGDYFEQYGGESEKSVEVRMNTTIISLMLAANENDNVLVVSHIGAILNFLRSINIDPELAIREGFSNCSVMEFDFNNKTLHLKKIISPS